MLNMNISLVCWTLMIFSWTMIPRIVLGVLFRKTVNRKPVLSTSAPPITNESIGSALEINFPGPITKSKRSNLWKQLWQKTTGGSEGKTFKDKHLFYIHPDRHWMRSTAQENAFGLKPFNKLFSSGGRLESSSRKDTSHACQMTRRKHQEVYGKQDSRLLLQVSLRHRLSGVRVFDQRNLEKSNVEYPLKYYYNLSHVHLSESSPGITKTHIRHSNEPIKSNVVNFLHKPVIFQTNFQHLEKFTNTEGNSRGSRTFLITPLPSFISENVLLNKFPFLVDYQVSPKSRGKRSDEHRSSSGENRVYSNDFEVDEEMGKDYSWDDSGSKEYPWQSEWEVDETSYVLPHETNKFTTTGEAITTPSIEELVEETREELVNRFVASHPVEVWEAFGLYDNSFLNSVHSHWLQFGPASSLTFGILCGIYCLIMVMGIGGNLLVIFMFIRCRSLRTPPNYLIVNLAVSDFLMMIKMPIFIFNATYGGPALGIIGCKIYGYVGGLSGTASIMTLSAIAIDRYTVIAYPINPMNKTTSSKALWMVGAVWVYSIFFSTLPFFGVSGYVAEGYLTSCSFDYLSTNTSDRVFIFIFFLGAFVFPLGLIVFSYVKIFRTVRSAEKSEVFNPKGRTGSVTANRESFRCKHDSKKQKTEVKIAVLSSTIILVWLVAWTPYSVVSLLGIFGYKHLISPLGSAIPSLFCKTAGCIDPFLYAIKHPRFQRELQAKLPFLGRSLRTSVSRSPHSSHSTNQMTTTDDISCRRGTSSPSFTHFETSRNRVDGGSLVNSSPHLTFNLREMKPLNASPPNTIHSGTKKRLKSSLKQSRRRNERISSFETSDENDKACGSYFSTSCPVPDETIHLLCDETLNYKQGHQKAEEFGDQKDFSCKLDNKDALSDADGFGTHKTEASVGGMQRESKCGLMGKVEIDRITRSKDEIAPYGDNDIVRNLSFKGYNNNNNNSTKLWRSKSATLNSNYARESVRESFQTSTRTYCTLVVRTESKRSGLFPYISYETTLL